MPEVDLSKAVGVFPKTKFSMLIPEVEERMRALCGGSVRHVILCGVEVRIFFIFFLNVEIQEVSLFFFFFPRIFKSRFSLFCSYRALIN